MAENNEILHASDTEGSEEMHYPISNRVPAKIHILETQIFS